MVFVNCPILPSEIFRTATSRIEWTHGLARLGLSAAEWADIGHRKIATGVMPAA
jgi:hypothetical protein